MTDSEGLKSTTTSSTAAAATTRVSNQIQATLMYRGFLENIPYFCQVIVVGIKLY